MTGSQRHTERIRSLREATALLGKEIEAEAVAGRYGDVTLVFKLQDGVVTTVEKITRRTQHVGPRKKAA